jgi:hypothetical protein
MPVMMQTQIRECNRLCSQFPALRQALADRLAAWNDAAWRFLISG